MNIKQYFKNLLYFIVYYSGALHALIMLMRLVSRNHRGLILFFHRFDDGSSDHLLPSLHVREFEKQVGHLKRMYSVATMDAVADSVAKGNPFAAPVVAITIDDGYRDNYTLAYPVLKKHGVAALVYLTAGLMDTNNGLWLDDMEFVLTHARENRFTLPEVFGERLVDISTVEGKRDALKELYRAMLPRNNHERRHIVDCLTHSLGVTAVDLARRERTMMTWNEVKEMAANGITFAAHTLTHPFLPVLPQHEAQKEIRESRERIEEKLGAKVKHFAIPNGKREDFTEDLRDYCRTIGFQTVVTTDAGPVSGGDDLFSLRRVIPPPPMHVFACEVARYFFLSRSTQSCERNVRRTAPAVISGVVGALFLSLLLPSVGLPVQRTKAHSQESSFVVDDFNFYEIPASGRPPKGQVYVDPVFHSRITRITDAPVDVPGRHNHYAQPGYPKHDIENADGSMLIVQSFSGSCWQIWNARPPYNKIREIPASLIGWGMPIDARWDNADPDILYYYKGTQFFKYSVTDNKSVMLHDFKKDFPDEPVVAATTLEEGDASDDRRYWAFLIRCKDPERIKQKRDPWYNAAYVVYDKDYHGKDKGKIISTLTNKQPAWREAGFISMSPSGRYVWIGDTHRVYQRDFSSYRDLGCSNHADMAFSDEGREVVVCGGERYSGTKDLGVWYKMIDLENGEFTWLSPAGKAAYHISGNSHDVPGWAVVSIYEPTAPARPSKWYDHSISMIELTRRKAPEPRVWRVAHTHTVRKSYADDPFAKINKKGTKIWFGSGWGNSFKDGQYDLYQIDLPQGWPEVMKSRLRSNLTDKRQ
ncbi:polysaccharide deacetylase family protein [Geobacter hydrogenophilus]|uniref:NodB homology domain-containing protein n=1 Tax=Geobacter hydrogenophilus TaxID=40983 RepID=A0A9W6LDR6_9BACT|nr:polysaccharide deacetylase family protein [Geobacter hydrogenophilus]MBT0892926.1 polysaccharide deacetylase family protein [Geobacter hydrogenophilus]GLI39240.1 hypothetical protein GHYDROH2_27410 [Geobacter hydrogenophilus]